MPDDAAPFTLMPDYPITRRKKYHCLVRNDGEFVMSSPKIDDCFEAVLDAGHSAFRLEGLTCDYLIKLERVMRAPRMTANVPKP